MKLDLNGLSWNSNKSKNHTCALLNLGNVMIIVMLNGILSSFSVPLNGCSLNGTVIGVRHDSLYLL